ncbi:hypothetical protein HB785_11280 [Listeria welshimeri]|uniref:Imm59 family immunity protein n=1 Tax=Listeria welshimeri TaxID=1643 RepID=UPI0016285FAC|nr:Imm59 family immunity protein [Listeria welshimeri]MBC1396776.1 hypothetical protein [Listeria welshimeri]MBC1648424.1 hypothetical protein [Listeria welshimeri]MBC2349271.1 hypothetical protein [Listeria welshimeri]MBF2353256.1 hypothetical protein [Listeria welshimeri]MBF2368484.1 hypothetical protein [Listeria welshimeri]
MVVFDEEKQIIQNKIIEKGYESLRTSVFNNKDINRQEWQTRIEYCLEKKRYVVYSLADRASLMGKVSEFEDFNSAKDAFFKKLDLTVKYNSLRVENNELPEYQSPIWNEKI